VTGHPTPASGPAQPGSHGEHLLQRLFGTDNRAADFYGKQVLDRLNPRMREFIARQEMAFLATADAKGECDCTFRAGPPGFIRVIDERMLAFPEYRGNGVMASLGNLVENGHVGILMVDFFNDLVGLHINGHARMLTAREAARYELGDGASGSAPRIDRWVAVNVDEAYIHCSKHIPLLAKEDRRSRVADKTVRPAGSDYFTGQGARSNGGQDPMRAVAAGSPTWPGALAR
jgi:predicted pyridoxine 5'-phosphate oxidase superfamily flavin-nucleotide-binding protein